MTNGTRSPTANFVRISRSDSQWHCEGRPHILLGRSTTTEVEKWPIGFVEWNWNGQELSARTCRYGVLPVYWYADDTQVILSDQIRTFQYFTKLDLDTTGVALLIRSRFLLGDLTPFKNVRRLPPGARLLWMNGKLQISGERPQPAEEFTGTRQRAIDLYIQLFRAAMQRCGFLLTNYVVLLSGGRDSRHILLELIALGLRPQFLCTALHIPPRRNYDAAIAAIIAEKFHLEHHIVHQPVDIVTQCTTHNELVDFCSWEHAWCMTVKHRLAGQYTTTDGLAGDILSTDLFQTKELIDLAACKDWDRLALEIIGYWDGGTASALFKKDILQRFPFEAVFEATKEELRRCADSVNPVRDFYFWNRARRGTSLLPFRIFSKPACITPYLDPDLFDFLCSLPPRISADLAFHTDVILQAYPDALDIPFVPIRASPRKVRKFWLSLALDLALFLSVPKRRRWLRPRAYRALLRAALKGQHIWWPPQRAIYAAQLSELFD
jgi:asparagine synthase (glutamine-hydrolysing)